MLAGSLVHLQEQALNYGTVQRATLGDGAECGRFAKIDRGNTDIFIHIYLSSLKFGNNLSLSPT